MGAGPGDEDPDSRLRAVWIEGLGAGGIGIDVEAEGRAGAGRLNHRQRLRRLAVIVEARDLMVRDDGGREGGFAKAEQLF
jgi:hypothetical protein